MIPCQTEWFYSAKEWNDTTTDRKSFLSNIIPMYVCPNISIFNKTLIPYEYLKEYTYYEFYVKAENDSVINSSLDLIIKNKPRVQFIWSALAIDSSEKYEPFKNYIDFFQSSLHLNSIEEIDIFFQPNKIYDDPHLIDKEYKVLLNNENSHTIPWINFL